MSTEHETYAEAARLLKELDGLYRMVEGVDASDAACKQQALQFPEEARARLREALRRLAGLV